MDNSETNLSQTIQEALKSDCYEDFGQIMTSKLQERPYLFEIEDHGTEIAETFKVAVNQNSFAGFRETIKPIDPKIFSTGCAFGICPFCSIVMAARSETYEEFKANLSHSFSES